MVKPLHFKGDKKLKKRKRVAEPEDADAPDSKALTTTTVAGRVEDDDTWVNADAPSDISGPIIIVLPTEPATCLACDANGKVFTSAIENFVDGDSATAEPHDVRQVWVANRVAGTESFSLKGHHGRYLSSDKYGLLTASATAISPTESFHVVPVPDNPSTFSLQTARDTFLSITEAKTPDVRGDADSITFNTTFRIRMQARFKPRHKVAKEERAKEKISKKELEEIIGRKLEDDEVRKLKRARREGNFHEIALDFKVKTSHDKYA
ncbi:actin-crosslinking protein [Trematosphaeria pertusa]|uniref:Actin-crosslinking protein n=1 Tax=Trematosphaeria pertusa TaxID=390896 RepID=A0A6A6IAC9_9PLEO|nr:actin-crosslinking protein [Trematosphaeria pertusa]KAF2246882.1 actin-crosslinking protein [Trematosphaeria pertusa]